MKYEALVEALYQRIQQRQIEFGLDRSHALLHALGHPDRHYPTIHVAGTNGKGSVSTKIASILQQAGYRVGLYTSPHLITLRERIRINGELVSKEEMVDLLPKLLEWKEATFFELMTAFAFDLFARRKVDIAVVEVGLGGRLDATNTLSPILSVITSIALDHTAILGKSREAIAREKGGIIKEGVPLILGPRARALGLEEMAAEKRAPLTALEGSFHDYIEENNQIAKAAAEQLALPQEAIEKGVHAQPLGRFQEVAPGLLLDVAHNADGMEALLKALRRHYPGRGYRIALALSRGREVEEVVEPLRGAIAALHLVESSHPRLLPIDQLKKQLPRLPIEPPHGPLENLLPQLLDLAQPQNELVVACGSCFMMEEAASWLGSGLEKDVLRLTEPSPAV